MLHHPLLPRHVPHRGPADPALHHRLGDLLHTNVTLQQPSFHHWTMPSSSPRPTNNTMHHVTPSSRRRHEAMGDRCSRQHLCPCHWHLQGAPLQPQPRRHHRPPLSDSHQPRLRSDAKTASVFIVMSPICRAIRSTANKCLSSKC
jgi:hypothetical protein